MTKAMREREDIRLGRQKKEYHEVGSTVSIKTRHTIHVLPTLGTHTNQILGPDTDRDDYTVFLASWESLRLSPRTHR